MRWHSGIHTAAESNLRDASAAKPQHGGAAAGKSTASTSRSDYQRAAGASLNRNGVKGNELNGHSMTSPVANMAQPTSSGPSLRCSER